MNLLLLSNSSSDAGYLTHALPDIKALTAHLPIGASAVFVPYAGVTRDWDEYTNIVSNALQSTGLAIRSLHNATDPVTELEQASVIIVGGGNTFNLLSHLRRLNLLGVISRRVREGAAYLGWSAGSNLTCPSICTTNDMPIVDPKGFDALGLLAFQINPHYTDAHPAGHRGETRSQRLAEFCALNPEMQVIGLAEGSGLRVSGQQITLLGPHDAPLFRGASAPRYCAPGQLEGLMSARGV